jgi:hypothetical protein
MSRIGNGHHRRAGGIRRGRGGVLPAALLFAGMLAAAGVALADDDRDRMIGILNSPIPAASAAPARVTLESTGIDCYVLPCPYWKVANADDSLLIGVERVVGSPEDDGIALETALWALLAERDYAPIPVEGYVLDRPRAHGQPPFQRVLVITAGPNIAPAR